MVFKAFSQLRFQVMCWLLDSGIFSLVVVFEKFFNNRNVKINLWEIFFFHVFYKHIQWACLDFGFRPIMVPGFLSRSVWFRDPNPSSQPHLYGYLPRGGTPRPDQQIPSPGQHWRAWRQAQAEVSPSDWALEPSLELPGKAFSFSKLSAHGLRVTTLLVYIKACPPPHETTQATRVETEPWCFSALPVPPHLQIQSRLDIEYPWLFSDMWQHVPPTLLLFVFT